MGGPGESEAAEEGASAAARCEPCVAVGLAADTGGWGAGQRQLREGRGEAGSAGTRRPWQAA